ncbi:MAG: ABC transporter permease [Oscillospiraceae bacterium]|nr:ABC transporter permease [Oscillospiraceae bacterium]
MKLFSKIYQFLFFLFLYSPIAILIIYSFNNSKSRVVWQGFTFKWYIKLINNTEILSAFSNTLIIAIVASAVATILGTLAAVGIVNTKNIFKKILINVTNLPMLNPEIITGISMMLLFVFIYSRTGFLKPGLLTLILSHITFCLPYVVLSVLPKLRQMDFNIYEAAQDLGCNHFQAFFKVVMPQITSGVVTGFMVSLTMSIDDFLISYFTSGTVQTLPLTIYSMTRRIISPEINALFTVLFIIIFLLVIIINMRKDKEKIEK